MKNYRDLPVLDKVSEDKENDWVICGASSMQGWRLRQEDAHFCLPNFDENVSLFGLFDGHGGVEVARYAAETLPDLIKASEPYQKSDYSKALIHAFREFDESLKLKSSQSRLYQLRALGNSESGIKKAINFSEFPPAYCCGSTAVVALLAGNKLFVANIGDSRCLIGYADRVVIPMTSDHLPLKPKEADRIRKAGGHVSVSGRVNHDINMSRAFGDYVFKSNRELPADQQMLISVPEIRVRHLNQDSAFFIVLVCDGIWNSLPNYCIADFIAHRIFNCDMKLSKIGEKLCDECYNPCNEDASDGMDNMTCVIARFKPGGRRVLYVKPEHLNEDEEENEKNDDKSNFENYTSSLVEAIKLY